MSVEQAKYLRKNMTDAEKVFWLKVRAKRLSGYKFKRQAPVGKYVVDFICHSAKLVVEIDGGQHNECASDKVRGEYLENLGFKVVRYWNNEVLGNIDGVLEALSSILSQRERR